MPYIGKSPLHGNFNELTDVSGSFDGSETEFALTENLTATAITPVMPAALVISINGVIQEPTTDYTVTGTNITFTTAPAATDSFFGIAMGKQLDVGTPSDSTVTTAKLASTVFTGATDIGAAIVDADLFLLDDGAGGTIRKTVASRIKTYVEASTMAVTGNVTATGTVEPAGDTAAGDNAAIGYTSAEGLILTGQGSTSDITLKNDADTTVFTVPTGTDDILFPDDAAILMGAGSDLKIFHNGSNSQINDLSTGNLQLLSNGAGVDIMKTDGEFMAKFLTDGGAELYHDNTKKFETTSDGATLSAGNLTFGTANKGVHLGVTSAGAANLLDDYEEGTWTPAFTSTSATFAYTTQGGTYTKVGRMCLLTFRLELDGNAPGGTTSNSVFISGLPFAIATLADTYHGGAIGHYFSINLSQTGVLAYQLSSGGSTSELKVVGDNLGETAVLASHLAGAAEIRGQIVYHTA